MVIIRRPRDSGKTTMLLHYMELVPESILIVGKEDTAKQVRELVKRLELTIAEKRIYGMIQVNKIPAGHAVLIDDIDYIIKRWPEHGYELVKVADIVAESL